MKNNSQPTNVGDLCKLTFYAALIITFLIALSHV